MESIIRNRDALLAHGNIRGRTLALDIIDHALSRIDASALTKEVVRLEGDSLRVADHAYPLKEVESIYVLGAGKGAFQIAEALDALLGDRIRGGLVIEKHLGDMDAARQRIRKMRHIKVLEAGHPIPDQSAVDGAVQLVEIARRATERDLVFVCVQGGCSSLTTLPAEGLTLQDIQLATRVLLDHGANIELLNSLRRAVTQLQGGHLAADIHPAGIINLVVNDDIWRFPAGWRQDPSEAGWGPAAPVKIADYQRLSSLVATLKTRGMFSMLPGAVRDYLERNDPCQHSLTAAHLEERGVRWQSLTLADPQTGAQAACDAARALGLNAVILSTTTEGEASQLGLTCAAIAKEIVKNGRPVAPPCAVILTGETTVTLSADHGQGGPNQECVLAAATRIEGSNVVIASVGTDGTDGPTNVAGGIADGQTAARARQLDLDLPSTLNRHNTCPALGALGDAIYFTQPGINVCDLTVILVAG